MSERAASGKARSRTRSKGNEGTIVKSVGRNKEEPAESVERFVASDCNDPAYVSIGGRITKNLGNYESVQISVSVTLPCEPTEKAVRDTRAKASSMVEEFVNIELESIGQ